ncbi:hypothetical protein B0H66DRAFT_215132 [Apodospora peruviana]|uniref:Uncharacterized protein n=1 Tax=Apodospora peruviana TaxID=516989 RepID=A0AAE0ID69_9PEZI|nr:hypothetical protein B0H66DRAFT_215132 [Apodospora peruviana]
MTGLHNWGWFFFICTCWCCMYGMERERGHALLAWGVSGVLQHFTLYISMLSMSVCVVYSHVVLCFWWCFCSVFEPMAAHGRWCFVFGLCCGAA